MKKLFRLIGVGCFSVLVVFATDAPSQDKEPPKAKRAVDPIIQARLKLQLGDKSVEARRQAARDLFEMAEDLRNIAIVLGGSLSLDDDLTVRVTAAETLSMIGPSVAGIAAPDLLRALDRDKAPEVRAAAAAALGSICRGGWDQKFTVQDVVPGLIRAMWHDKHAEVRRAACRAFQFIGPLAHEAATHLLVQMQQMDDERMREFARASFGAVTGPKCAELTPTLLKMYKEGIEDYHTEFAVILALGKIGADEKTVVPLLIDALQGNGVKNTRCRNAAGCALGEMGPKAKDAVPFLIRALEGSVRLKIDDPRNVSIAALDGLRGIGAASKPALPLLTKTVDDEGVDEAIRFAARFTRMKLEKQIRE
jgi:HEAT repeat protein